MSRNVSILSVLVMMAVTVMATAAVAFAIPNEGGNGQTKVILCHNKINNPHTIIVGAPALEAHLAHGDTEGACAEEPTEEPTLVTQASGPVTLGQPISDTATLSGVTIDATGTITFHLYPTLADCQAATNEIDTGLQPVAVNGSGDYPSGEFTPSATGTYYWTASYSGDDNGNDPVEELSCPENEASVVSTAPPTSSITTDATDTAQLPAGTISDQATLTAPDATDGNIVFRLYGPFTTAPTAAECTAANLVTAYGTAGAATVEVVDHTAASNPYNAPTFTPTTAGIYQWTAQFNSTTTGVDSTTEFGCGDATEQSVVAEANSTIATEQVTTLALHHKMQRLHEINEKLQADETPREQKEALRERRQQLREEITD